jgi:hypothetical protein
MSHETTNCKEVDGLSKEAMGSLKQLKPTAGDRQARWETLYAHLFPEGSPIPDPCKDYITIPKFLAAAMSVKLTTQQGLRMKAKGPRPRTRQIYAKG